MGKFTAVAALHLLLFIPTLALHARASQEAHLTKFILSRRRSTTTTTTTSDPTLYDKSVLGSLRTDEYPASDHGALKVADKIPALPGQPKGVDFDQYGGYVTVGSHNGRALFYYFVEAPGNATAKPLLLWLNGGPGCSSLGHGAMRELGPFRANRDGKTLTRNKHAWNNVANVIFLESPAGVGFSYSNTSSDYDKMGDPMAAQDAYVFLVIFLVSWLDMFPEYKARPLYITGESYAGHYIPQLAATILAHNSNNNTINLKGLASGIMVGNPYLDKMKNLIGHYKYLWSHGAISDEVWADIAGGCSINDSSISARCYQAITECQDGILDHDNIYAPTCIIASNGSYYSSTYLPGYDPCSYVPTKDYLNSPQVQKALHARETKWLDCRSFEDFKDSPDTMVPTLKRLIDHGLPIWLFSGDFDSVCPFTGTKYTIRDLNLSVTEPWRPWTAGHEVGGYVQQYAGGFTFATVRGAGHMVPAFQPERAMILLQSFLTGILPAFTKEY
ncbi:serine carboxypeptidase 1-like [Triticum urartu]|uniref:serine carboxypeptidase 1-like n=1 Tax=Triticum urartu TaxID=4572 RepID=UPI002042F04D|nr:serine carboxypeptidase 1-like [Triticum urartu]